MNNALNVSYKVDTREIPKLPANKALEGCIFNDWQVAFHAKICQVKVADILEPDFVPPEQDDLDYDTYKTKSDWVKNHLISATVGTYAFTFIDPEANSDGR